jgi:hypothetical protein
MTRLMTITMLAAIALTAQAGDRRNRNYWTRYGWRLADSRSFGPVACYPYNPYAPQLATSQIPLVVSYTALSPAAVTR